MFEESKKSFPDLTFKNQDLWNSSLHKILNAYQKLEKFYLAFNFLWYGTAIFFLKGEMVGKKF